MESLIPQSASQSTPQLQGASSQKQPSLDARTLALCIQTLHQMRSGLSQSLLYALGTRQFDKVCENTFAAVNALLSSLGDFTLHINRSDALFNGVRLDCPSALKATIEYLDVLLNNVNISSIEFQSGMTQEELGKFLQMLARKKFDSNDGAKVNKSIWDQGITHLKVGELRFVALGKGEKVVSTSTPGLSNHAMAQSAVGELVSAFNATVQHVQDHEAKRQLRAEITEQLLEKDETMLGNILSTVAQRLRHADSDQERNLIALPSRDGKLLNQALQIARSLIAQGTDETDPTWLGLCQLIEQIVAPYSSRAEEILPSIKFDPAITKLLPDWLNRASTAMESASANDRLDGILAQSPCALLDERMFPSIVDVLDELSVAALNLEAERLTAHVAGALKAVTKGERMQAVQRLSSLLERSMEQCSHAVIILENALLEACTHETCDEVMKMLLNHLSERCIHHYKLGNFKRSVEHLEWIVSLEESSRSALREEGANIARQEREKLGTTEFASSLVNDLLMPNIKGETAVRMVRVFGKNSWSTIIERIRIDQDVDAAAALTRQLESFGNEAKQLFFFTMTKDIDSASATRMLEMTPSFGNDSIVSKHLSPLLLHPDSGIRGKVINYMKGQDSASAVATLRALLQDEKDVGRRMMIIAALGQFRNPSANGILLEELEAASAGPHPDDQVLAALLDVLSAIDDPNIIPAVSKLICHRGGRTLMMSSSEGAKLFSKSVTLAAMKALARYYQHPDAIEALERARKDNDSEISRVALVCLRGIVAAEKQQAELSTVHETIVIPPPEKKESPTSIRSKSRRGFEVLENEAQIQSLFQPGTFIGSTAPDDEAVTVASSPINENPDPIVLGIKPNLQGLLQDLGLIITLRMVGSKDGLLIFDAPAGLARIYIRDRKILGVLYAQKTDFEALVLIDEIKKASFTYYIMPVTSTSSLDLDIDKVKDALRQFRDNKDENAFF